MSGGSQDSVISFEASDPNKHQDYLKDCLKDFCRAELSQMDAVCDSWL